MTCRLRSLELLEAGAVLSRSCAAAAEANKAIIDTDAAIANILAFLIDPDIITLMAKAPGEESAALETPKDAKI